MSMRRLRIPLLGVLLGAALLFSSAPPARAVGENPTIDGDLTDLIAAVNANLGSSNGGFVFNDPVGDVYTAAPCAFVNGYDIKNAYAYFRLKDATGAYTPNNLQLYLGWEVSGVIGDVDGDGNPDTFDPTGPGQGCAISDGAGIGAGEIYSVNLDLNCDGVADLRLGVTQNTLCAMSAAGAIIKPISGAFAKNGHFLEMRIDNYQDLIKDPALVPAALGADLCRARIRFAANAVDDGLGEDSTTPLDLLVLPHIKITKLPASQDACPGTNVSWTIQVCNESICLLNTLDVADTLDTGLTYVSDDQGSTQGTTPQIRKWHFTNLGFEQCVSISLTAGVDAPCVAPQLKNNVTAVGTHDPGTCGAGELEEELAHVDATVNCTQPDVAIAKSFLPPPIAPGQETTVTLTISNPGSSVIDPVNVCDKLDAGVTFNNAQVIGGTCQAALSSDTPNADGTRTICFSALSLNPGQSCTITYKVGCATIGAHPDTATVTAFCKGTNSNPIVKRAFNSFFCECVPSVQIGKSVSPPLTPGQGFTVTLNVSNPGNWPLDPVTVCDKLDAGVTFNDAQVIGGTCLASLASNTLNGDGTRTICFSGFSLDPGQSCTITYNVGCSSTGDHPDTATVTAFCKGTDNKDVKQAFSSFSCPCLPDVKIGKTVGPTTVKDGDFVTVTLTVSNAGQTALDNIKVCDKLDAGVGFDASQVIGGSCGVTLASNTVNSDGSRSICFTPFSLDPGQSCTITYQVSCVTDGVHPDTATVIAHCKNGSETDVAQDEAHASFSCQTECCWLTMGGFLNADMKSGNKDNTFGGNVGPPPSGSWEHIQRNGKTEVFNFHSHDAHVIDCGNDGNAGPCHPAGDANFIDFGGTGAYSINGGARTGEATFTARAEDHGEPGNQPQHSGGCGTPDYYTITVKDKTTGEVVFTAAGFLDGGNVQIHDCKHASKASAPAHGGPGLSTTGTGGEVQTESTSNAMTPLELYRPIPNPFQNTTTIGYAVGGAGQHVEIAVYNVAGRLIRELVNGFQPAGRYQVVWEGRSMDGSTVPGGVYFLRAYVGGQQVATGSRMLYLR